MWESILSKPKLNGVLKMENFENDLKKSAKINVEKNNGITERFSYEKLLKSLIMVETPFF